MSNLLSPFSAFLVPDLGSTIIKLLFQQLQRLHWILLLGGLFLLALLAAILAYALRQSRANWQSANRRLIRLNQASQTLSSTLDLDQVLVTFLEQVRQLLDVTACSVWLVDPQSGELVCRQAGGPRGELVRGWRLAPGEGVVGWVIQHGKSIVVPDVRTEALHFPGIDRQTGLDIRSVVGLPLRIPQRIIGALEVVDTAPHRFSTNDVLLLESLAISAAIAIENAHLYQQAYQEISQRKEAEQALRESESRYRNLVDGVPVGIFQSTPEGKILDANPAYVQMLGYPDRETLLDTPAAELYLDPEDRARWCTLIERQGVVRSFEAKLRRYDGTTIWVRESAHTVRDNQGQALYYEGAMEDITEQKLAAQKIQRQTETLAALHETALALATQQELPDLLRAIVARAVELLRAKGGGIYLYRSESHDLELALTYNLDDNQVGAVLQPGEGLSGEVLRTGQPLIVENYNHWAGQSEKFSPASKPSCIAVPIHWAERPLGVLYLADELPRLFSSEDVTLLEQLAPLAGATLEQRRLLQQTRARWQEAETLRQAGAAVTEILSMDERLERILEQLGYVVPYDSASVQLMREDKLEIVGGRGFPEPQKIIGWQFPVPGDNPNTIVVQERRPVILRDARTAHTPFRESPHAHIRSWLGVPLIVHDRVIGLLSIDSVELNHFNQKHVRLVTPLADQIAVALENARLYDDLQQQMDELKRTQAQLVQSAKLAAVGELAAGVAHELNNPLTGVLGYAEIAMIELEPEHPSYKDLQGIRAEALRASRIVRHLLQFSRQSEPKRTPADINQVTRQTLDVIRYHLQTSNVQVEESYEADLPPLSLDEGQIRQVLLNLITNAFQAMPQGGQLRICSERRGDQIGISISDTGEGIAKDNLERIFDPFYSTKPSGTGLGLSVSLGIVQEHGGRITVESQPGQGSTFTVWLPIE